MLGTVDDAVQWGRTRIAYEYRYAERKTLANTVHPDLRVTVIAPHGAEPEVIRDKVRKRGPWIRRQWRELELYLPKQPPRRYVNGESHRYLGRQYRLRAERGANDSVKCLRGYFRVTSRDKPSHEQSKWMLECWYLDRAERIFRDRLEVCHERAQREGIPRPALKIRRMQKRWGSCSPDGRITLNDVGLFVTTGGFAKGAQDEARTQEKRKITLIDRQRLVELWIEYMDRIGEDGRQLLPLKPIWFLAPQN